MSLANAHGVVVVSIDLELDLLERSDWLRQRALAEITPLLSELCDTHQISATWAVADPAISAATDVIRGITVPQEIALLGDASWIGPAAGPARFARELSRRVHHAREAGVAISSLLLRGAEVGANGEANAEANWDLLAGHGLNAIRSDLRGVSTGEPKVAHFGIREFPVNGLLPASGRWWNRYRARRTIRHSIEETARLGGLFHLAIDTPAMFAAGDRAVSTVQQTFRQIQKLSSQGRLTVETLSTATNRLGRTHSVPPAASILRAA